MKLEHQQRFHEKEQEIWKLTMDLENVTTKYVQQISVLKAKNAALKKKVDENDVIRMKFYDLMEKEYRRNRVTDAMEERNVIKDKASLVTKRFLTIGP